MSVPVAIVGSGNIGSDLMIKILRNSKMLTLAAMAGVDPESDGLARARRLGVPATHGGIEGLLAMPQFEGVRIVFDATSAAAHRSNYERLKPHGKQVIDLTPAAIGPYVVPVVNMAEHLTEPNLNMVSCGGQATIPIVAAVGSAAKVHYAETVATVASRSAGPGTRANIDEFTRTTARAMEKTGGAARGKAIIILNPAEPPILMRNTIFCLSEQADPAAIREAVEATVAKVRAYVPGYRLKQQVQVETIDDRAQLPIPGVNRSGWMKTSVFLEVEGAGHYLPPYAGNLDIMTSAAMQTAECIARGGLPERETTNGKR